MAKRRAGTVVLATLMWGFTALLVLTFGRAGLDKFDSTGGWAHAFATWGDPAWLRLLIGFIEVEAALLLIWPRTAATGAALIVVVMLGGMGTHIVIDHAPQAMLSELFPLIFASFVLMYRWRVRLRLSGRSDQPAREGL